MKITDILKQKKQGVSFEFFPPKAASGQEKLKQTIKKLKSHNPLYVSMTYGAGGTTQERTKEAVSFLANQHKELEVMPHLTCIGSEKEAIENLLNEYKALGISNLMALRGDIPEQTKGKISGEFSYAGDIVAFIKNYGHFCIGVAVYPQGHAESKSLEADIEYTKMKIDAGADFAVTQMFFANSYYYDFMERARAKNITIPIIPGILPLTNLSNVQRFCAGCGVTIPEQVKKQMLRFEGNSSQMLKAGLEITINQCRGLIDNGFKQLHIFTLNKADITSGIIEAIGS